MGLGKNKFSVSGLKPCALYRPELTLHGREDGMAKSAVNSEKYAVFDVGLVCGFSSIACLPHGFFVLTRNVKSYFSHCLNSHKPFHVGPDFGASWFTSATTCQVARLPDGSISGPSLSYVPRSKTPPEALPPRPYLVGGAAAFRAVNPLGFRKQKIFVATLPRPACSRTYASPGWLPTSSQGSLPACWAQL